MFENGFPREWSTIKKLAWLFRSVVNAVVAVLKTVTGNPIHILDALAKPAQALSVNLEPIQDLHGYDNPWPAGGGKNLFQVTIQSQTKDGITFTVHDDGTISTSGIASADGSVNPNNGFTFKAGVSYVFNGCPAGGGNSTYSLNFAGSIAKDIGSGSSVYTPNEDVTYLPRLQYYSGANMNGLTFKPMLRLASIADATFAPYSNICPIYGHTDADVIVSPTLNPADGTTYPFPLGQTVYGGTLDVLTGVLTVTMAMVDLGTLSFNKYGADTIYYAAIPNKANGITNILSDKFFLDAVAIVSMADGGMRGYSSSASVYFRQNDCPTLADWNTWLSNNPTQLCYELATPITIQLTPTQVELLQGENNLFSDGEMTLVYLADGNASDVEALNILLGGRYVNNHTEDEPTDREALDILLGGTR